MEVKRNTAINFGKNQDILLNLGKAVREAQTLAYREIVPDSAERTENTLRALNANINDVLQDKTFPTFIRNAERYLSRVFKIGNGRRNLKELVNNTDRFGQNNLKVKARGFRIFEYEFWDAFERKFSKEENTFKKQVREFVKSLTPKVDAANDLESVKGIKDFETLLSERFKPIRIHDLYQRKRKLKDKK